MDKKTTLHRLLGFISQPVRRSPALSREEQIAMGRLNPPTSAQLAAWGEQQYHLMGICEVDYIWGRYRADGHEWKPLSAATRAEKRKYHISG